jgi:hypothetical protein
MKITKRLQIPVSEQEYSHFQATARRVEALGVAGLQPSEALALLKSLNAPVGPVETMVEESVDGSYS